MTPIRVLIVDDHPMVRRGLRSLLSSYPDIEVAGDFADGVAVLECAANLKPDVILMDIKMPGLDGVAVAQRLRHVVPEAKIIHLTAYEDAEYLQSAFRAGAYANLLKSVSDETVVDTEPRDHAREHLLSPTLIDQVLQQFQTLAQLQARSGAGLSEKDVQLLKLISEGATNEEIAKAMYWSARTVKRRVEEISAKLEARNRTQAVTEAIKRGLI